MGQNSSLSVSSSLLPSLVWAGLGQVVSASLALFFPIFIAGIVSDTALIFASLHSWMLLPVNFEQQQGSSLQRLKHPQMDSAH